jgi:hypothetical protein
VKCPLSGIDCEECGCEKCFLIELVEALKAIAEAIENMGVLEEG